MPEMTALDESLEEHDKKYHGGRYDPKTQTCGKRAKMGNGDKSDRVGAGGGEKRVNGVTEAEDAAYMDAVKRGDMETAARMVREAAARYGYKKMSAIDTLKSIGVRPDDFDEFSTFARLSPFVGMFSDEVSAWVVDGKTIEKRKFDSLKDAVKYIADNGFDGDMTKGRFDQDFDTLPDDIADYKKPYGVSPIYYFKHRTSAQLLDYMKDKRERETSTGIPVFVRFGSLPKNGVSRNFTEGRNEPGVSVFNGLKLKNGTVFVTPETPQQIGTLLHCRAQGRKLYVATGDVNGVGSDGEPTLSNAKVLSAKEYTFTPPSFYVKGDSVKRDDVTYDDAGNVIPLSRRFDDGDDIRGDVKGH